MKLQIQEGIPRITINRGELEKLAEKSAAFSDAAHTSYDEVTKTRALVAHSSSEMFSRVYPLRGVQVIFPNPGENVYAVNLTDEGYSDLKQKGSIKTDFFEISVGD